MIEDFDVLANIFFFSEGKGGRKNMLIIKNNDYIYRPTVYVNNDRNTVYSAGIVINNWRPIIIPEQKLESMQVLFLKPEIVIPQIKIGSRIDFLEGTQTVAYGIIEAINQRWDPVLKNV